MKTTLVKEGFAGFECQTTTEVCFIDENPSHAFKGCIHTSESDVTGTHKPPVCKMIAT